MSEQHLKDNEAVKNAYAGWVSFYDYTFGIVSQIGRKHAVRTINRRQGRVLEVGVGTGISLQHYENHLEIYGIDISPEMLKKAEKRKNLKGLSHVKELKEMSACTLDYPDNYFDVVVGMYLITVVPNPNKVMKELRRVCKPGGEVMLVNHFSTEKGLRGWVEHKMVPLSDKIGWHPVFPIGNVLGYEGLKLIGQKSLQPAGVFTMLRFSKEVESKEEVRHNVSANDEHLPSFKADAA